MTKSELVQTAILALLALGVSAGQDFKVTGWTVFFWGGAALILLYSIVTRAREEAQPTTLGDGLVHLGPRITLEGRPGLARLGMSQPQSADLVLQNTGAPFTLVAHAKLIDAHERLEGRGVDAWSYHPRGVNGAVGQAFFHMATMWGSDLRLRGEGMQVIRGWVTFTGLWFDVEWKLYVDREATLHKLATLVLRVSITEDQKSFVIVKVSEQVFDVP